MMKPKRLKPGDKIAVVSLSWGGLGDPGLVHKYHIAKERLEREFGLNLVPMPHALEGSAFVARHPELRAKDLMDAFQDETISAIFCAIGGSDTVRLLPFIDFEVIRRNPKIFMGYSDSTVNHLMMYKAGLTSFYGPSIMCEFGEYVGMFDYTKAAVQSTLFQDCANYLIPSSPVWSDDFVPWDEKNTAIAKTLKPDAHGGYEVLQGECLVRGHLLGGCIEVFSMVLGTELWPSLEQWRGAILFIETSEEKPSPEYVKWILRNLAAQGILRSLKGILVGKPQGETYYEEYKTAILQVVSFEEGLIDLPIFYNVNFGHAMPIGILPYGIMTELDCGRKRITLLETATL
jgi:muramoyltetrapeptide carboxypeptidase LdcA involved in peptidoglycan recycling